jgi:hypothetical protein
MAEAAELVLTPPMPTPEAIAAVQREPRFSQAVAAVAVHNLRYYQRGWLANRLLNDRARFGMALASMFLHFSYRPDVANSGLTAERFRDICVRAHLCGAGRVEGVLLVMRATGYLERAEAGEGGIRRYVVTPKLIAMHRERNRQLLSAVDLLRGDTNYAGRLSGDHEDAFYPHFCRAIGQMFLDGYRLIDAAPALQKLNDRDAGMPLIIYALLGSPEYAALVPEEVRPVTVAGLARRLNVSRTHVRSVQRDAESAGLLIRHGDATQVTVLPRLADAMANFFASAFVMIESCAQVAAAQTASIRPASDPAAAPLRPAS